MLSRFSRCISRASRAANVRAAATGVQSRPVNAAERLGPEWAKRLGQTVQGEIAGHNGLWNSVADAMTANGQDLGPAADGKAGLPKTPRPRHTAIPEPGTKRSAHHASHSLPATPQVQNIASQPVQLSRRPATSQAALRAQQLGQLLEQRLLGREGAFRAVADAMTANGMDLGPATNSRPALEPKRSAMPSGHHPASHGGPTATLATNNDLRVMPFGDFFGFEGPLDPQHPLYSLRECPAYRAME